MKPFSRIKNPRDIRKKLSLNQSDFWSKIGITQSGGSRYESGRSMSKPVRELLRLVYLEHVPLATANGTDLRIAALLREQKPDIYEQLQTLANGKA